MSILIVDDSFDSVMLIKTFLKTGGYTDILTAKSAYEAFNCLGMDKDMETNNYIDIILLDIVMPELDGIEVLKKIKDVKALHDIPVIMVTAQNDNAYLLKAFDVGAIDYVTKPINKIELLARVRSALKLKNEMDRRMELMCKLEEANTELKRLTFIDGLTGIANRRYFDEQLGNEWKRMQREQQPISLIMIDIDFFKKYNDHHGHQGGDHCLKLVAQGINSVPKRPADLAARYGGEEFALILPKTEATHAERLAENCKTRVAALEIAHGKSDVSEIVTLSLGVATKIPTKNTKPESLIKIADKALYKAKENGRNRFEILEN